jgi:hypothetical protein
MKFTPVLSSPNFIPILVAIAISMLFIFRPGLIKIDRTQLIDVLTEEIASDSLKVVHSYGDSFIHLNSQKLQKDFVEVIKNGEVLSLADRLPIGVQIQHLNVEGKAISLSIQIYPHWEKKEGIYLVMKVGGKLHGNIDIFTTDLKK